jgi:hypothetical protein
MKRLRIFHFPPQIGGLLHTLSEVGFFERSLLIGSWVMPLYEELYGVRYMLRTLDVDFAVHLAHREKQRRADLEQLITNLGFVGFITAGGLQKFTAAGYEVEFIVHRSGGREIDSVAVPQWNINAVPLPFISVLTDFSELLEIEDFTIRTPIPESYFIHKLIVAHRRRIVEKREKDLNQCAVLVPILSDERLLQVMQAQRIADATRRRIELSCKAIDFPLQRLFP